MPAAPVPVDSGARAFFLHGPGRAAAHGFCGCVLVVVGGLGAGAVAVHDPILDGAGLSWLRYGHGKIFAGALVYIGLLVMFYAWVRLGRAVRAGRVTPRRLVPIIAVWTAPLVVSVPVFSRDAYAYLAQGALFRDGFDPYTTAPVANPGTLLDNVSTVWTTTPSPYGPLFLLLARGVTSVTGDDPVTGTIAIRLLMLPGLALMVWAIPRIARALGGDPATALWLAVANPFILVYVVGGPHNDALMVGVLTAGIALVLERRYLAGVALIAAAAAIKIPAAAALPFMVWARMDHEQRDAQAAGREPSRWTPRFLRAAVPAGVVSAAMFAAATAAAGAGVGWIAGLSNADDVVNWLTVPTAVAQLYTVATSWFTHVPLESVLAVTRLVSKAALVLVLAVIVVRYRRSAEAAMRGLLYAMIAILVLSVAAFPWYYSWPLAIAAGFALSDRAVSRLVAFSVFMMLIFRPDGSIGMYQWYQLVFAAACATVAAAAMTRPDPLRLRGRMAPRRARRREESGSIAADTGRADT